jgi:hypothetical protein
VGHDLWDRYHLNVIGITDANPGRPKVQTLQIGARGMIDFMYFCEYARFTIAFACQSVSTFALRTPCRHCINGAMRLERHGRVRGTVVIECVLATMTERRTA